MQWENKRSSTLTLKRSRISDSCLSSPLKAQSGPAVNAKKTNKKKTIHDWSVNPANKTAQKWLQIGPRNALSVQHSQPLRHAHERQPEPLLPCLIAHSTQDSVISLELVPPPFFFFFVKRGRWWPVPECPTRISDVLRLERSNSAPSVASSALLLYCNLQSLHGKLCAGGRSDFQLVMMMMREDITWLHWFHNHAALWGLTPACAVQHRLSFK